MIGFLRGTLSAKYAADVLIDVGGVGYEVSVPMSTYYDLPAVGGEVALFTHLTVCSELHTAKLTIETPTT